MAPQRAGERLHLIMTDTTRILRVGDEYDRLDAQLDEYAAAMAEADDPAAVKHLASETQTRLSGVAHLRSEHGPDATVEIQGLSAGDYARVEDAVAKAREHKNQDNLPGYHRNQFVAEGLIDGPFMHGDTDRDDRVKLVADLPVGVVKWLEERINDATAVGSEDFQSLGERLAALSGA